MQAQPKAIDHDADIPYGPEVFIIAPVRHAGELLSLESPFLDALRREFPQFQFSIARPVEDDPEGYIVLGVGGVVGDGRKASPILIREEDVRAAIVAHLNALAAHEISKPN